MQATVTDDCTACELSVTICPDVFEMGPDTAQVKGEEVTGECEDSCRQAAESCPVEAIKRQV